MLYRQENRMKAIPIEPAGHEEQRALTRYIPWLLQTLLLLSVWPYLTPGGIVHVPSIEAGLLLGVLLLLVVIAGKAGQQKVVTVLVCVDTVVVSDLFVSLGSGQ